MDRRCGECGTKVTKYSIVCHHCGTRLDPATPSVTASPTTSPATSPAVEATPTPPTPVPDTGRVGVSMSKISAGVGPVVTPAYAPASTPARRGVAARSPETPVASPPAGYSPTGGYQAFAIPTFGLPAYELRGVDDHRNKPRDPNASRTTAIRAGAPAYQPSGQPPATPASDAAAPTDPAAEADARAHRPAAAVEAPPDPIGQRDPALSLTPPAPPAPPGLLPPPPPLPPPSPLPPPTKRKVSTVAIAAAIIGIFIVLQFAAGLIRDTKSTTTTTTTTTTQPVAPSTPRSPTSR